MLMEEKIIQCAPINYLRGASWDNKLIIADESPATISDKIKDMLFAKSADRVDNFRPDVASNTFGDDEAAAAVEDAAAHISGEVAAQADTQESPAEE